MSATSGKTNVSFFPLYDRTCRKVSNSFFLGIPIIGKFYNYIGPNFDLIGSGFWFSLSVFFSGSSSVSFSSLSSVSSFSNSLSKIISVSDSELVDEENEYLLLEVICFFVLFFETVVLFFIAVICSRIRNAFLDVKISPTLSDNLFLFCVSEAFFLKFSVNFSLIKFSKSWGLGSRCIMN
jgi:hypothetical protein